MRALSPQPDDRYEGQRVRPGVRLVRCRGCGELFERPYEMGGSVCLIGNMVCSGACIDLMHEKRRGTR